MIHLVLLVEPTHPATFSLIPYHSLPEQVYQYVLGIDFGWVDSSAFVVGAYAKNDDAFYIVECYKKGEMLPDELYDLCKEYWQ